MLISCLAGRNSALPKQIIFSLASDSSRRAFLEDIDTPSLDERSRRETHISSSSMRILVSTLIRDTLVTRLNFRSFHASQRTSIPQAKPNTNEQEAQSRQAVRRPTSNNSKRLLRQGGKDYKTRRKFYDSITTGGSTVPHRPSSFSERMKCSVQVLTTPTADTPGTALILHFDNKRYLIGNVAEGTQRAFVQRKVGMLKLGSIFMTGPVAWSTAGGLLGMILTFADAVSSSRDSSKQVEDAARRKKGLEPVKVEQEKVWLNIHGGKNVTHLLATARRFVFRKGTPLLVNEHKAKQSVPNMSWDPTWQDDNIKVWAMVVDSDKQQRVASPRKRSHDEFSEGLPAISNDGKQETLEEQEDRYDQMRRGVVSAMFDSTWRLDTLVEKKLSEVKMPTAVFIRNEQGKIERYRGPTAEEDPSIGDRAVLVRNPWPGALIDSLPPTTPSTSSMSYIIRNHPQRGKFDPAAALKLKVKKGPNFALLTRGVSVIAEDGSTVTPEMVLGEGKDGGGFAVVELPDSSYVQALVSREEWSSKEVMTGVGAVIWILGDGVLEDPRLQQFMKDRSDMKHIVSSKDVCPNMLALESAASAAIRLHLLDSDHFPIPIYNNETGVSNPAQPQPLYIQAKPGQSLMLEPVFGINEAEVIPFLDTKKVVREASKEVFELAEIARKEMMNPEYQARLDENQRHLLCGDAEVIPLGTGSALPSKYRNVSATLVRVPGYGNYLIDCGENTLGQLKRVFGDELPEILRDLKLIWISHLHADHHLGTANVIKAWSAASTPTATLAVASDEGMLNWLREYADVEDYGYDRVRPIFMGSSANATFNYKLNPSQVKAFSLSSIRACEVTHCHGALAVLLSFPNGFSIAYSGDCRPSPFFAKMAKGATLLIHEATFDDELQGDAKAKKHSTTSEALDIARQMGASRVLLTHFSQRYQKIPVMESNAGKDQVAIVAFDYMRIKLKDFAKFEAFKPALMKLYEQEENET